MDDVYKTTDKKNRFSVDNKEILNPTPMQPPLGYRPQLSLAEQIRQQVRQLKSLDDMEPESEDEADDFEIQDDPPMMGSRWENDQTPSIKEVRARYKQLEEQARLYAVPPAPKAPDPAEPGNEPPA